MRIDFKNRQPVFNLLIEKEPDVWGFEPTYIVRFSVFILKYDILFTSDFHHITNNIMFSLNLQILLNSDSVV